MAQPTPLLVVAFDIGTTFSGYAFSFLHEFREDKLKVTTNKLWQDGDNQLRTSYKTPTVVLINPCGQFHSFGYQAETDYANLTEDRQNWLLFRRFKMNLYKAEIADGMQLESVNGKHFDALRVFAMAIRYLEKHFRDTFPYEEADSEIQYIVTVPAIWDERAKQFMRKAAVHAGIPGAQLGLALEPEAAAISCQAFLAVGQSGGGFDSNCDISATGCRYVVVDAGGGTVDTTVHERVHGEIKELHKASGGGWGGTYVDEAFYDLLVEIFSLEVMQEFGSTHRLDQLDLEKEFEVNKQRISGTDERTVTFRIPASLRQIFDLRNTCSLEERVAGSRLSGDIRFTGDKMRISGKRMLSLMTPAIDHIVSHVKTLLEDPKCTGVSHILLVGGFSDSPLFRELFGEAFPSQTLVTPVDGVVSVMKGAVMFGHDRGVIGVRLASYTYGISVVREFIDGEHDPRKSFVIEGVRYCKDLFSKFVTIDEEVPCGKETEERICRPVYSHSKEIPVLVYTSELETPKYTTDPFTRFLGSFTVVSTEGTGIRVGVRFVLGSTELKVVGQDKTSDEVFETTFNFLSK